MTNSENSLNSPSENVAVAAEYPESTGQFEISLVETGVTSGSIPITWCIDPNNLPKSSCNEDLNSLYVVFSCYPPTEDGAKAEWRGWAKLLDMVSYITAYRPGKNRIIARVVKHKLSVKEWMRRDDVNWNFNVVEFPDYWNEDSPYLYYLYRYFRHGCLWNYLDVDLPSECFAKKPSDLEDFWVNFFFRHKSVDQCEFRRRRMLAYTIQPIVIVVCLVLYCLVLLIAQLVLIMCGKWIVWESIFSPTSLGVKKTINFLDIQNQTATKLVPVKWIFRPVPIILLVMLGLYIKHINVLYIASILPVYLLVVYLVWGIGKGFGLLINWYVDCQFKHKKPKKPQKLQETTVPVILPKELLCSSDKRIIRIKDLPKGKKTIKLIFQGLKSSVCRPFAR